MEINFGKSPAAQRAEMPFSDSQKFLFFCHLRLRNFDLRLLFNAVMETVSHVLPFDFVRNFVTGIKSGSSDEDAPEGTVFN